MDRYGGAFPKKQRNLAALLKHMVDGDRLIDAGIPIIARCGNIAIAQLTAACKPSRHALHKLTKIAKAALDETPNVM